MNRYRISFNHVTDQDEARDIAAGLDGIPGDKIQAVTVCRLLDSDKRIIGLGYAFCSKKDSFSYEKGRRVALAEAVQDAFPYIRTGGHDAQRVNVALRRERDYVWSLYFSRNDGRFDPRRRAA